MSTIATIPAKPTGVSLGVAGSHHLLRGDDHLGGLGVAGALDGVVQQADRPHDLAGLAEHIVGEVGRIAHDELAGRGLAVGHHALDAAVVVEEQLVGVAVQHEHAALDGAEAREALGQPAQAVHGVEEGRGAVLVQRVAVELHRLHRLHGRLVEVVVVQTQRHRVAREVHAVLVQAVFLVQLAHRHVQQRNVLVRGHAVLAGDLHGQHVRQEAAVLHLLHQGEQRSAQRLLRCGGHLGVRKTKGGDGKEVPC